MISIITPVLNGRSFIESCISSVMALSVPYEHIMVDGGSTDGTIEMVADRYPHVIIERQTIPGGMYAAIHQGFTHAKYPFISWLNCDDVLIPDAYSDAIRVLYEKDIDFLYGDGEIDNRITGKITKQKATPFIRFFLTRGFLPFNQPSSIYRKNLYMRTLLDYSNYRIVGDLDLFIRIAKTNNVKFYYFRHQMTKFLIYGDSLSDRNRDLYQREMNKLIRRNLLYTYFLRVMQKIARYL